MDFDDQRLKLLQAELGNLFGLTFVSMDEYQIGFLDGNTIQVSLTGYGEYKQGTKVRVIGFVCKK